MTNGLGAATGGRPESLHPALAAWREVHPGAPEVERVEVLARSKKSSVFRLVRPGAAPLIAKLHAGGGALYEREIYEEILSPAGVSRLAFLGALGPGEEGGSWSFTEDAGGLPFSPVDEIHRAAVAAWLGGLHVATAPLVAAKAPGDRGGIHQARLAFTREALVRPRDGLLSRRAELDGVARVLDAACGAWPVVEEVLSAGPSTLVHGDFGPRNVRVRAARSSPEVVAYDWEMAVVGSPAVDLWWLGARPALRGLEEYNRAASPLWRDVPRPELLRFARVGLALRLVDCIYWSLWNLEWQLTAVVGWSGELDAVIRSLAGPPRAGSGGGR